MTFISGESEYTINNYGESVKKLLGLPTINM